MRLLRGLSGKALPCGCLVGTYETYDGRVVTMIDARGNRCPDPGHRDRAMVYDARERIGASRVMATHDAE